MSELRIEDPTVDGDSVIVAARLVSKEGDNRLWYRVEGERADDLTLCADPFVIGTIHQTMTIGEQLFVHGRVSPSLLRNLELFQQAWSAWKPDRYKPVEINAAVEEEAQPDSRSEAISGFSGGVDSCFTAYRHAKRATTRFPYPIRAVAMVHGFDIPLDDDDGFRRATIKAQRQLDDLGLELYRVATNFREQPVDWVDAFAAGVMSVLSLFQGRFRHGLIAQGVPFSAYRFLVEGSNPLTDPLLSSEAFSAVPDGAGYRRTDKIAVVAEWPAGLEDLRVCSRNTVRDENCCVCEKCIRNILSFRALGIDLPVSFRQDVTEAQIWNLVPIKPIMIDVGYGRILEIAEDRGLGDEPWVVTLRRAIRNSRRFHHLKEFRTANLFRRLGRRIGIMR